MPKNPQPRYLLCDEAATVLDASTQAQAAAAITGEQQRTGLGVLLITPRRSAHDPLGRPGGGPAR